MIINELKHFAGINEKTSEPLCKKTIDIYNEDNGNDNDNMSVTDLDYENLSLEWDVEKTTTGNKKNCNYKL